MSPTVLRIGLSSRLANAVKLAVLLGLFACDRGGGAGRPAAAAEGACGELPEVHLGADEPAARRAQKALSRAEKFRVDVATWHCEQGVDACDGASNQPLEVSIAAGSGPACVRLECPDGLESRPLQERLKACQQQVHVPVTLQIAGAGAPESTARTAVLEVDADGGGRVSLQSRGSARLKQFFRLPDDAAVREFVTVDLSGEPPTGEWSFGREQQREGMVEGTSLARVELRGR